MSGFPKHPQGSPRSPHVRMGQSRSDGFWSRSVFVPVVAGRYRDFLYAPGIAFHISDYQSPEPSGAPDEWYDDLEHYDWAGLFAPYTKQGAGQSAGRSQRAPQRGEVGRKVGISCSSTPKSISRVIPSSSLHKQNRGGL